MTDFIYLINLLITPACMLFIAGVFLALEHLTHDWFRMVQPTPFQSIPDEVIAARNRERAAWLASVDNSNDGEDELERARRRAGSSNEH